MLKIPSTGFRIFCQWNLDAGFYSKDKKDSWFLEQNFRFQIPDFQITFHWGMHDFVCSFWLWGSFVWPGLYILCLFCLNTYLLRIGSPWWWSSPWWRHFVLRWSSCAIRYNTRGARLIRNKNTGTQLFTPIPRRDPGKKVGIGHFRVPKTLTAKVLWKLVLFAWNNCLGKLWNGLLC